MAWVNDMSELGSDATRQDVENYATICEWVQDQHPDWTAEDVQNAVWGDGDWYGNARRLGFDTDSLPEHDRE